MPQRLPVATIALLLMSIAAFVLAPLTDASAAQPQRSLFWLGVLDKQQPLELWRLISAHLLHTDWNHLLWNLTALALLAGVIEQHSRMLLLLSTALGMVFVGLWFFFAASTRYYCGWSGALNTLLFAALYPLYWRAPTLSVAGDQSPEPADQMRRRRVGNALIALIIIDALLKNLYELGSGTALVSDGRWTSAPGAHLAGWLAGLFLAAMLGIRRTGAASR